MRNLLTQEQREELISHPIYRQIKDDLDIAFEHLAGNAELSPNRQFVLNAINHQRPLYSGDGEQRRALTDPQLVSFLYTGHEVRALMAMIEAADTPILPVHDCLVCREKESIAKMEQKVFERTGFNLRFSEEIYPEF